jgi:hypothetical protein
VGEWGSEVGIFRFAFRALDLVFVSDLVIGIWSLGFGHWDLVIGIWSLGFGHSDFVRR